MNFGALLSLITYSIFFAHYPKNLNPPKQLSIENTEVADNQTRASRLESIKHLWNLLQTARPVDRNNPLWRTYGNTPLPPMKDGYGIQVNYQRQYEGIWKDGDLAVGVVSYPDKKYAINANFRITSEDGLNTIGDLDRYKGLPLHEILYFHELVFSQLYKCDCLVKTDNHRVEEWERVEYELRDAWGVYAGTEFKNELRSRLIPGFRNNSRSDLYIRSFSRTLSEYRVNGERQMMYFDNSFMIGPNSTIRQIQFSTPLGSTQAVSSGQVYESRFSGPYVITKSTVDSCKNLGMATAKSITTNASNQPVKNPSTNTLATRNGYTIEVHSYTRNTNFAVKAGEKLNIEATGSIVLGGWVGSGGPEGISGYRMYCIIPNYQLGALLFRVGNGEWKAVGTKTSVIMQSSGMLQLMVNDSDPDNNSGSFQVKITK